jgi:RNA polymerase sigma-70 factor (ECF subfamily)
VDPERALVAEAAVGNREAFDELVRRHQVRIYRLARVLTGGDGDAEDLAQETFVRAFRGIGRFRGDSSFGTWLHRIAVNVIKSHVSRRARRPRMVSSTDASHEPVIDNVASQDDFELAIHRRQAIDDALGTLPDDHRSLIVLRDIQGLEYHEIATITGLPLGTVESRIFRSRQRLRPLLEHLFMRSGRHDFLE